MLVPSNNWRPTPADPKVLCNKILADTIKDEDKFQEGLTKIFFRAGMLALLESRRSNRLNELVILIQKNVKRRLAAQHYQTMRKSAIRIQTWWRGIAARKFVLGVRQETAALRLQRAARAFIQRSHFHVIRNSIISIQSCRLLLRSPDFHTTDSIPRRHSRSPSAQVHQGRASHSWCNNAAVSIPWHVRDISSFAYPATHSASPDCLGGTTNPMSSMWSGCNPAFVAVMLDVSCAS